ncbi:MAG: NUDIX hydrolase [Thermovirgaceae bacterium]
MDGERKVSSNILYRGRIINLKVDNVILPSGQKTTREVVEHAPAVAVLAMDQGDRILLVRQNRYPVGEALLEIPAGLVEPGENARETAVRELREETGYQPRHIEEVLRFYTSPGFTTELIILFLATGCEYAPLEQDFDENIELETVDSGSVADYVANGKIRDAKTLAALCWHLYRKTV